MGVAVYHILSNQSTQLNIPRTEGVAPCPVNPRNKCASCDDAAGYAMDPAGGNTCAAWRGVFTGIFSVMRYETNHAAGSKFRIKVSVQKSYHPFP